ncbi:solute carrier family 22 member 7-like [Dermacentor albipictus]|uniref:solute carrier family 22 member 7-like n=1 Tax=Dermacentor albipictus TaxID=60249 RepID=UPI0031FD2F51
MTSQKRDAAPPPSHSLGEKVSGPNPVQLPRGADRDEEVPLGDGRFQKQVLMASMLAGTTFLLHLVSFRLTTRIMDHWCRPPDAFANLSVEEWRNLATPIEEDGSRSHCARRDPPDGGTKAYIVSCEAWDFDYAPYGNNIVSEWRLVCDRRWLIELAVLTYMVACVIALPIAGVTADRIGRKVVINVSLAALLVAGFTTSFANSYLLFVALRIVVSVTSNSLWLVQYSVLYEVSTPASRDYYCFLSMAVASVAMPLCVLGISRMRLAWDATHLVLMVPATMLAAVLYTVRDESPAWLLTTMDTREAERVALKATRMNNADAEFCRTWFASEALRPQRRNSEQPSERNVLSTILKQQKRRFLLLCYMWSALSFAFNQVNLNDIFPVKKAIAAAGILGMLPMYVVAYFFMSRCSAKRSCMVAMLLFSILAVALTAMYGGEQPLLSSVLVVLLRMLANLFVVLAFVVTVKYYPVKVRCTGICVGFALGRLTGSLGEVVFRLAPKHRRDAMIAVVAIVMALASLATEYLPPRVPSVVLAPASISTRSRRSSRFAGDEVKRWLQASLPRLPRGPVKARSSKGPRSRDERLPEQFLLRAPNISQS